MNNIHPTAIITDRVVLGDNITIGAYSTIGFPPEHKGFNGDPGLVYICSDAVIRECVTIHAPTGKASRIGVGAYIMSHAHIGHDAFISDFAVISTGAMIGGHAVVGIGSYVGLNASLHQFAKIGDGCILGAGCFFKGTSEDNVKLVGSPARSIGVNHRGKK
jgi:UDP-N-acetylglucosamine acyltransferase